MLRIVVDVDAPIHHAQGIKEDLTAYLERFGDTRVISVTESPQTLGMQTQIGMDEWRQMNALYGVRDV